MTDNVREAILQVARSDRDTPADQLAALARVCSGDYRRRRLVPPMTARRMLGGDRPISAYSLRRMVQDGRLTRVSATGKCSYRYDLAELAELLKVPISSLESELPRQRN